MIGDSSVNDARGSKECDEGNNLTVSVHNVMQRNDFDVVELVSWWGFFASAQCVSFGSVYTTSNVQIFHSKSAAKNVPFRLVTRPLKLNGRSASRFQSMRMKKSYRISVVRLEHRVC